jgi:hypothetical protein
MRSKSEYGASTRTKIYSRFLLDPWYTIRKTIRGRRCRDAMPDANLKAIYPMSRGWTSNGPRTHEHPIKHLFRLLSDAETRGQERHLFFATVDQPNCSHELIPIRAADEASQSLDNRITMFAPRGHARERGGGDSIVLSGRTSHDSSQMA